MHAKQSKATLIAHRGWSKMFPENSMPAFEAAISAGADEIEFDVRSSRDLVPMICHDATTDRVSDLSGSFNTFSSRELRSAKIKMGDSFLVGLGFPTLQDVLAAFSNRVIMNIHIKELDRAKTALHLLAGINLTAVRGIYIAGDETVLQAALETCPHIPRCLIQSTKDTNMTAVFERAQRLECERIQFFKGYYQEQDITEALQRGFIPNLFWEDEPEAAERVIKLGVKGLLTNDLGPVRQHLLEQGLL